MVIPHFELDAGTLKMGSKRL